jgi:hypothetical protein
MWADEDILLDYHRAFILQARRAPIKVGKDGRSETDRAVFSDRNVIGMAIVEVNKVGYPNILSDVNTAQLM